MSIVNNILSDFHYLTQLPVSFLDADFLPVATTSVSHTAIPDFDHSSTTRGKVTPITTQSDEHFIIAPFNERQQQKGYFLIGPYQSIDEKLPTIFKPYHLTQHFIDAYVAIVKRNIASSEQVNPHIAKGLTYINENFHESVNLQTLCDYLGLNICYFCVLFKDQTGMTFSQYLNKTRINASKELLATSNDSIIDISLAVGFNNHNHFSATFKKLTGTTPTLYRSDLKK